MGKRKVTGTELRAALDELGLTQAWLARRLGKHPVTVSRWCRGDSPVPEDIVFIIYLLRKLPECLLYDVVMGD